MIFKLLIPTAGTGSRLGNLTKNLNKSLVSVGYKPVISHILDKVDPKVPVVIALGYQGGLVREYLSLTYPERDIEFIEVTPYEGLGSGLGTSILFCEPYLQCPFIFCSCDTIILESNLPAPDQNWMGYAEVENLNQYRTVSHRNGIVQEIHEKGPTSADSTSEPNSRTDAYIGLAGIADYSTFWSSMKNGREEGSLETGEAFGLKALDPQSIQAIPFRWLDTGNPQSLSETREELLGDEHYNILEKEDEAIWFVGNQVVKYSQDTSFIKNRVKRSASLEGYVPLVLSSSEHMYSYAKRSGSVLSKNVTLPIFQDLLDKLLGFWKKRGLPEKEFVGFKSVCNSFYKIKTEQRVEQFFKNFQRQDRTETINGIQVPTVQKILSQVNWNSLSEGIPSRFHGDLHFENILYDPTQTNFCFLDWRQDFGGNLEYGDLYYDLAKLNHGLIICHELIHRNLFAVDDTDPQNIRFDFHRKQILVECEKTFRDFVVKQGFDPIKVEILTSLIYLNIAALHHYPYSLLLFYLGKSGLHETLRRSRNEKD